jgi:hypothetical protein
VPEGTYNAIRFRTGSGNSANILVRHPEMQYPSAPESYCSIFFAGKVDTAKNAGTANMQPYSYRLGTEAANVEVTLPDRQDAWTLTAGGVIFCHLTANYAAPFSNINTIYRSNLTVASPADMQNYPGNEIAKHIAEMFSYEE